MEEEIEQINVEPEFPFNPFEDCPDDDCEEDSKEKINNETDVLNLFTFTKPVKKRKEDKTTRKCPHCDKVYKNKYMATHLRVNTDDYSIAIVNVDVNSMNFSFLMNPRRILERSP